MNDPGATHFYGDGCDESHGSWAYMEAALKIERALADDAADILDRDGGIRNERQMWLARYREMREQR